MAKSSDAEFEKLRNLLDSGRWPPALYEAEMCTCDDDKWTRAENIMFLMDVLDRNPKSFLDFGCGEGHLPNLMFAETCVGYDITQSGDLGWEDDNGSALLTTDLQKVRKKGPYDLIMIYDVIDHVITTTQATRILKTAKGLLAPQGEIRLVAHPWYSRNGAHLHDQLNAAFVHLVFTEGELREMGYKLPPLNRAILRPKDYVGVIEGAGLKTQHRYIEQRTPEPFFSQGLVARHIAAPWRKCPRRQRTKLMAGGIPRAEDAIEWGLK